jgi:hypothetical protein
MSNATELLFGAYELLPTGTDVFGYVYSSLSNAVRLFFRVLRVSPSLSATFSASSTLTSSQRPLKFRSTS